MPVLIDANVILRVLLHDVSHPKFEQAVCYLVAGGAVRDYVVPEVVFNFMGRARSQYAGSVLAQLSVKGQEEARTNWRHFLNTVEYPEGFKKNVFQSFKVAIQKLLLRYPNITIDQKDLFDVALGIACETGHDWVDCMLEAERQFGWVEVASLDKDLTPSTSTQDGPASTKPGGSQASKLSLPK